MRRLHPDPSTGAALSTGGFAALGIAATLTLHGLLSRGSIGGAALMLAVIASANPLMPPQPEGADEALSQVRLQLGHEKPYRYVLAYRGPLLPYRGPICYSFAGYNETCINPRIDWLTPATDIELYAPGGVPRELLVAYVMEVRYPALSERTFRYTLPEP